MSQIPCKQSKKIEMTGILKSGIYYRNLLLECIIEIIGIYY